MLVFGSASVLFSEPKKYLLSWSKSSGFSIAAYGKCEHFVMWCMGAQSCLTLCDPMDCSPPGFSVTGILQARILEWFTISCSRGSFWPPGDRDGTAWTGWRQESKPVSCFSCLGRLILYHCATWEAPVTFWPTQYILSCWLLWGCSISNHLHHNCPFMDLLLTPPHQALQLQKDE